MIYVFNPSAKYSRLVGVVTTILLTLVFLTYRSFDHTVFYINWVAGLAIIALACIIYLLRSALTHDLLKTVFASSAWIFIAIIVTPFATDQNHHLEILTISIFYIFSSIFFTELILKSSINPASAFYYVLLAWFLSNLTLFLLFIIGIYLPEKSDFSGVFHDRNVFSITTLIVIALAISFLESSSSMRRASIIFMVSICFLMVLTSRSITGFLGILTMLVFYSQDFSFKKKIFLLFFILSITAVTLVIDNPIKERIDRFILSVVGETDQLDSNESAYIRMFLLKNGFQLGLDYLSTGVGLDNARLHVIWSDRNTGSFLHNNYLDILTSGGLAMFISYYLPVFYILFWLFLKRKYLDRLSEKYRGLWRAAFLILVLKLLYDFTWTTYFEFGMVFSLVFSFYVFFILKDACRILRLNTTIPLRSKNT